MTELALALAAVGIALLAWLAIRVSALQRHFDELPPALGQGMEDKHRAMLSDLHDGLGPVLASQGGAEGNLPYLGNRE